MTADQPTLSDRIADTIRDQCPANPATLAGCSQCTAQHAAVMAEVQPELDAKDAEIARQAADADRLDQLLIDERATTARLGRQLRDLRAQQNGDQA